MYEAIESGAWHSNVYPVCSEFPCSREEFDGGWTERFDYDFVKKKYDDAIKTNQLKAFYQELMLRITSEEDKVITNDDISWFSRKELLQKSYRYNFYITTDFATSVARKADYTVIGVWAVDNKQNRYLVDGVIGRQTMDVTFNYIFNYVKTYSPLGVGVEISGQQGAFLSLLRTEMDKRNIYFSFARSKDGNKEGIPARVNKMERFRLSVPFWKNKKMYLPIEIKEGNFIQEILDELSAVTIDGIKSKHDDCLDMISQLEQMFLVYPDNYQSSLDKDLKDTNPYVEEVYVEDKSRLKDYVV